MTPSNFIFIPFINLPFSFNTEAVVLIQISILFCSGSTGRQAHLMNLREAKRFHETFRTSWRHWLESSPWKDDPMLMRRVPVALAVKYGQNIPIAVLGQEEAERREMNEQRDWLNHRFITYAIASHVR